MVRAGMTGMRAKGRHPGTFRCRDQVELFFVNLEAPCTSVAVLRGFEAG